MSLARQKFIENLAALNEAIELDPLAAGSVGVADSRGVVILRRGMLITSLIALETFVRDRTTEVLDSFSAWPASFEDLPAKFREAAIMEALPNLQRYAKMLKRQDDDYEGLLIDQISKMSMTKGPVFGFSKFVSGDYTGNLSDSSMRDLLSLFQIKDCWNNFRTLAADVGIGVPSVHELMKDIVRNRHKSAHSADYVPTIADIQGITLNLTCIGLCFDIAMSAAVNYAMADWKKWAAGTYEWLDHVILYFIERSGDKYRLTKNGQSKAVKIVGSVNEAPNYVTGVPKGSIAVIMHRDSSARPIAWRTI